MIPLPALSSFQAAIGAVMLGVIVTLLLLWQSAKIDAAKARQKLAEYELTISEKVGEARERNAVDNQEVAAKVAEGKADRASATRDVTARLNGIKNKPAAPVTKPNTLAPRELDREELPIRISNDVTCAYNAGLGRMCKQP